ncbi:MAG: HAD domain-containing protein [Bacilli bacterium]
MIIPNKIIFLDIDGVLNSNKYFSSREYYYKEHKKVEYTLEDTIKRQLYDIDMNKLELLLEVVKITTAKIVITSSWRRLSIYPYIKKYLIEVGLPIIGETPYIEGNRGEEIRYYLKNNKVDSFVILDDEIFKDFNELINNLVKTSFYGEGLTIDNCNEIIKRLKKERKM